MSKTHGDLDGKGLFEECQSYVEQAQSLIDRALALAERVHGNYELTPPSDDF